MNIELDKIINILKSGGVVALPTDTVYGLVALYGNKIGYDKIYRIKNRPKDKKLILFIDKIEKLYNFCDNIDAEIIKYLDSIWPGDVTVILKTKDGSTLGFRIPDNKLILDIINILNTPLYSTSANISGIDPAVSGNDLDINITNNVDYVVDGVCKKGKPSTIIDISNNNIKNIIRN